ncbi:hypothetical protein [Rubinisphaera italica]|uniref:Uncharacterized protein n=1 Tax=Rubinisphaera italica TaxID=2527969 RepID=A0A5C5XCB3_9PLAN|nr:hypothetical protein [Rubinisphaera italica]TWT59933.1 hypothetical protein Pan54_06440 [Rubinisphaera italica]
MFNKSKISQKISPGKLLLILTLSGVLYLVFPRGEETSVTTQLTDVAIQQLTGGNTTGLLYSEPDLDLAKFDLEQLIEHNPFQKSKSVEEVSEINITTEQQRLMEGSKEFKPPTVDITAILYSETKRFALIDNVLYPEGGVLPSGQQIAEIHSTYVRFVPSASPAK